ncbi:MAG: DUF1080 domain-containing protein [Verrucomicrobiota bacterium]
MLIRPTPTVVSLCSLALLAAPVLADKAFYGDPPDATHPWGIHDRNRPQPPLVTPGTFSTDDQPGRPPSDAIVLFDGTATSLGKWEADKTPAEPTKWVVVDGALQCVPGSGYIRTKQLFADCQLHVEWASPTKIEGTSQQRGNSGIFLMGQTEVQVLNNFDNPTYADGFAGSVYGVNPPHANALHAPGEWQVYDIIFRRPIFRDGKLLDGGRQTVLMNGVVVQDSTPLEGGGGHRTRGHDRSFGEKGPLKLQDHGNPVRYRNIWLRPLPLRAIDGGDMGVMSPIDVTAKKTELAKSIRADAAKLQGQAKLLRLMESICYDQDPATTATATAGITDWLTTTKSVPAAAIEDRKAEILEMRDAIGYLVRFKFLPADFTALPELGQIVKAHGWDKK